MRHVVFRLGRDRYALPLDVVREVVVAPERYTRVPHAAAPLKGVIALRGKVVPVADLARLLEVPDLKHPAAKVLLLDVHGVELGLAVTEVEGIEAIEKLNPHSRASRLVRGLARVGALPVTVLAVDGLDAAVAASVTSG